MSSRPCVNWRTSGSTFTRTRAVSGGNEVGRKLMLALPRRRLMQEHERTDSSRQATKARRGLHLRGLVQLLIGIGALVLVIAKSDVGRLLEAIRSAHIVY